jgi:arylformamidase
MESAHVVDLTQPIDGAIPMFPGLPGMEVSTVLSREHSREIYSNDVEFLIQRYQIAGNCGTYMDAPFHRYPDGRDLSSLPLPSMVAVPGLRIDARDATTSGRRTIDESYLNGKDIRGRAVLFWTGWDERWPNVDYLELNPFLSAGLAERLVEEGATLVGIDTWNIDDTQDMERPAHSILLRNEIPIVENLRGLDALNAEEYQFHAAPLPIRRGSAIPVRAYAVIP